jgi:hypothetical protein
MRCLKYIILEISALSQVFPVIRREACKVYLGMWLEGNA